VLSFPDVSGSTPVKSSRSQSSSPLDSGFHTPARPPAAAPTIRDRKKKERRRRRKKEHRVGFGCESTPRRRLPPLFCRFATFAAAREKRLSRSWTLGE